MSNWNKIVVGINVFASALNIAVGVSGSSPLNFVIGLVGAGFTYWLWTALRRRASGRS